MISYTLKYLRVPGNTGEQKRYSKIPDPNPTHFLVFSNTRPDIEKPYLLALATKHDRNHCHWNFVAAQCTGRLVGWRMDKRYAV